MLKKEGFYSTQESKTTFGRLKFAMCTTPVLALLDLSKPFIMEIYACYGIIGAVLMPDRRPIAHLIQALGIKNIGLFTYEKELLTLVTIVTK